MKKVKRIVYDVVPFTSLKDMLYSAVARTPDNILFKYKEKKDIKDVTFKAFLEDVNALGTALCDLQVVKTHVAMLGSNSYRWLNVYLTALLSDNVFVPIDKELPFADIINVLNQSDSTVLFYDKRYEKDIKENLDKMSNIKYFIGLDRTEDEEKFLAFNDFIEKGRKLLAGGKDDFTKLENDTKALKMIVYTSGTTGMAKGVMLSEHNLMSCVYWGLRRATIFNKCLSVLPYNHTYEAVAGILVGICHNATICINESLKAVLKNLQTYKPEYIYLVPAFTELFYKKIWAGIEEKGKTKLIKTAIKVSNTLLKVGIDIRRKIFAEIHEQFGGELREIVCGGAPIRPEVGKFFNDIGIILLNGYGISECSPLVSVNPIYFNDSATVGFPLECVEINIADKDEDGIGEICVKGDIVMMGYYKQPEITKEVLSEDGWFKTGDFGMMNEYGQLIITGRKKNLIVLDNGKNIFPEEIEGYIQSIPYVKEVIVYGVKNDNGLEDRIAAEVYLDPEMTEQTEDVAAKLKADVTENTKELPSYKKISEFVIRDKEFEKTTTNKIRRQSAIGVK